MEAKLTRELREAKHELNEIDQQIRSLKAKRREICSRIEKLKRSSNVEDTSARFMSFYDSDDFEWSQELNSLRMGVFKIEKFRSLQRGAINATISGIDTLLIMPTGGGKSLCFQLPCLIKPGITVVVSPLLSLMEDQLMELKKLEISTMVFNSQTNREETKQLFDGMLNPLSPLKLIYITPEKLAKSKTFMAKLERMYDLKRFSRLVIDEVHCCSQWGHDFRPDYKFLGIMKRQFPETPILGLTATATPYVINDIQKMLDIEGCLVLKDSFFRPNLKYEIMHTLRKDESERLSDIIKKRFGSSSGIIYCLTVKETTDLAKKLKEKGIRASCYHAQLTPEMRSKIHKSWYNGVIQVIVATIAFGMGINKMNVRFVIHYSMSKSIENYYQETGRAGRDGHEANCILLFRFQDVFRATSLYFTERNTLKIIYQMVKFCINQKECRKKLLAQYFGDADCECKKMCDNCCNPTELETINVYDYYRDIVKIIRKSQDKQERITALKLMEAWLCKGSKSTRVDGVTTPKHDKTICETILLQFLIDGYLKEEFHFTPYSTISYISLGTPPKSDVINVKIFKTCLEPMKLSKAEKRKAKEIVEFEEKDEINLCEESTSNYFSQGPSQDSLEMINVTLSPSIMECKKKKVSEKPNTKDPTIIELE